MIIHKNQVSNNHCRGISFLSQNLLHFLSHGDRTDQVISIMEICKSRKGKKEKRLKRSIAINDPDEAKAPIETIKQM